MSSYYRNVQKRYGTKPVNANYALKMQHAAKKLQRFYRRKKQRRMLKAADQNNIVRTVELHDILNVTADGSGNINTAVTNNCSGAENWASWAALYDTYKVYKITVKYIATDPADVAAGESQNYILKVIDQDENPSVTTEADMLAYHGVEMLPSWKCWTRVLNPSNSNDKWDWRDISETSGQCAMQFYRAAGFGASQQVGNALITYLVKFKGSKM